MSTELGIPRTDSKIYEKTKVNDFFEVIKVNPELDSNIWDQIGRLRAKTYVHEQNFLLEDVLDSEGREYDEHDSYSDHYAVLDENGKVIGYVRAIPRNRDVLDNKLPAELHYPEIDTVEDASEISRLIIDSKTPGKVSMTASMAMLTAAIHDANSKSPNHTFYGLQDAPLTNYLRNFVGVEIISYNSERKLNDTDTVDALVEINTRRAASSVARFEQSSPRRIGYIDRLAPYMAKSEVTKGLGRIALSDINGMPPIYDRNIGFINKDEQELMSTKTIAIAGLGGDGGAAAVALARMGFTKFVLADPQVFGYENLNRQHGADFTTIGINKASVIADEILRINPYASVKVMTDGINPENIEEFLGDADLVIDETEYSEPQHMVLLADKCRDKNLHIFTGYNVGFGAYATSYSPSGKSVREQLGIDNDASMEEVKQHKVSLSRWLAKIPSYADMNQYSEVDKNETPTPSLVTGVYASASILVSQVVAHVLSDISPERRKVVCSYPEGLSFDPNDDATKIRHPRLYFLGTAAIALFRTKVGKNPRGK